MNLLLATRHLLRHPALTEGRSTLVATNSCEEGLGNLRGMRAIFKRFKDRIGRHVAFDLYLGDVFAGAVGSVRWCVEAKGPGGHSWSDAGRPSAILALAHLVCAIEDVELPRSPKTTMNVGQISGGTTVNAIAERASMLVEVRSEDEETLCETRKRFEELFEDAGADGLAVTATIIGERPGGRAEVSKEQLALTERARRVVENVTGRGARLSAASTDANIALSRGIPAMCLGTVAGGGAHTRDEWVEVASLTDGLATAIQMMCLR